MLIPNETWEDKDQFLDVIYWSRQVVAILMGIIWGFVVKFNSDNENMMDYVKEGFMTSFAAFMVAWTIVYSAVFF
ncbi:hypothetical protein B4U80_04486 [Leptotrombidium deliense]|uniref:Uncharacterized protein n=1 Tax=Leptotrombidium deliense TaxID=299467 RepID=A0A443S6I8_9ACAR|nr:hypothetical protein B4U80_04486 [Leptotrombidium deliense]